MLNLFFRFHSIQHFNSSMLRKTPTEKKLKVKVKEKIRQKLPRKRSSINKLNNPIKRKKIKSNTNILKNSNLPKKKFPKIKRHKSFRLNRRLNYNNNKTDKMDLNSFNDKLLENKNLDDNSYIKKTNLRHRKITNKNNNTIIPNEVNVKYENKYTKENEMNELPYTLAIIYDKRNIFKIFFSLLSVKFELVNLIFGDENFKIILVCEYILSLLINFFFNTLLYSDEVISDNYHNNGKLDYFVTIVLSLLSNIITSIIIYYIKFSKGVDERIELIKELKLKNHYVRNVKKYTKHLKLKFILFFIGEAFIVSGCFYYIVIFCIVYEMSKVNIIINYLMSLFEGIITAVSVSFIVIFTRKIGLVYKNKYLYNTSKFINNKF